MDEDFLSLTGADPHVESRIKSFELAFRMQTEAPELMSIAGETEATKNIYGIDDPTTENFGHQCLLARRFSEQGVRFVQCTQPGWDHHSDLFDDLPGRCRKVDNETLVLWGGEFGRTPGSEISGLKVLQPNRRDGRDHNPHGFTMFMAGGGVKPGISYGETDEYGYFSVKDKVHIHDLHATMLHLLGVDHTRLTYRYQGRDFRLTDVHGNVVHDILA
jgi:hypothetical protein